MRKITVLALAAGFLAAALGFSNNTNFDPMKPAKRKELSSSWLETGKAFLEAGKNKNARASFMYAIEAYPMGDSASEARSLLKEKFNTTLSYNPVAVFNGFVKRAEKSADDIKLNLYLMALEVKDDANVDYQVARLYYKAGSKNEAKDYLVRALAAGLDKSQVEADLLSLVP